MQLFLLPLPKILFFWTLAKSLSRLFLDSLLSILPLKLPLLLVILHRSTGWLSCTLKGKAFQSAFPPFILLAAAEIPSSPTLWFSSQTLGKLYQAFFVSPLLNAFINEARNSEGNPHFVGITRVFYRNVPCSVGSHNRKVSLLTYIQKGLPHLDQAWWCIPVILAFGRVKQEETHLGQPGLPSEFHMSQG